MRRLLLLVPLAVLVLATACWPSTLESARRNAKPPPPPAKPLSVKKNPQLTVDVEAVLSDENATAVVVSVTNRDTTRAAVWVPIAVKLRNASGKVVATNIAGGNDPTLTHFPSLPPGGKSYYVDDQFPPGLGATSATVVLGGILRPLSALPTITVSNVQSLNSAGLNEFKGTVSNGSTVKQEVLIVQGVARKSGKIVAAGTGIVNDLGPGQSAPFTGVLVGNPAGASLDVFAPPTQAH